jgi:hypothetical protein
VNGISINHPSEALYELTMSVAEGRLQKAAVAVELERIAHSKAYAPTDMCSAAAALAGWHVGATQLGRGA